MKLIVIATIFIALLGLASAAHMRKYDQAHAAVLMGLDTLNPLQNANLLNGDWTAVLPESIRQLAIKMLGESQDQSSASMTWNTGSLQPASLPSGIPENNFSSTLNSFN